MELLCFQLGNLSAVVANCVRNHLAAILLGISETQIWGYHVVSTTTSYMTLRIIALCCHQGCQASTFKRPYEELRRTPTHYFSSHRTQQAGSLVYHSVLSASLLSTHCFLSFLSGKSHNRVPRTPTKKGTWFRTHSFLRPFRLL